MQSELLGLAFAAGLLAAVNPCGFAMLPTYLVLVVSGIAPSRPAAVTRAAVATLVMTAGFLIVFGTFGVLTVTVASTVQQYLPVVTVVIGVALICVGGWLLSGRELHLRAPEIAPGRAAPTRALGSMFGYGVAYAIASLSCTVGPFLAVTGAALRTGSATGTVVVYLAYAAGFALVVGTLAVAAAFASTTMSAALRRLLPVVSRIGGALTVLIGAYVAYYGVYELRLFHGNGDPDDAVVAAAGRLQSVLAGWVHNHGGWPWVIVLAALLIGAIGWTWRRNRHRAANMRE